jgi:hypothetical protein
MPIKNLILRLVKGSPLTASEHDENLTAISNAFNGMENKVSALNNDVTSATAPTDTTRTWSRLDSDGVIEGRYRYVGGKWVRPHSVSPSSFEVKMWRGDLASIDTLDGGSSGAVTDSTGPFWQVDTDMSARFPVGVGTLPSTTAITVGGVGGEEKTVLTVSQLPAHAHDIIGYALGGANVTPQIVADDDILNATNTRATEVAGEGEAHNNLPPYIGRYFLKRTARKFIVAT